MASGTHDGRMQQEHRPPIRRLTVRTPTARDLPHPHAIAARAVNQLCRPFLHLGARIRALEELKIQEAEADLVDAGTYTLPRSMAWW